MGRGLGSSKILLPTHRYRIFRRVVSELHILSVEHGADVAGFGLAGAQTIAW
jgi:hypothetical protein